MDRSGRHRKRSRSLYARGRLKLTQGSPGHCRNLKTIAHLLFGMGGSQRLLRRRVADK
jgi:hypothetical protein